MSISIDLNIAQHFCSKNVAHRFWRLLFYFAFVTLTVDCLGDRAVSVVDNGANTRASLTGLCSRNGFGHREVVCP